jgi:hypothetical protein
MGGKAFLPLSEIGTSIKISLAADLITSDSGREAEASNAVRCSGHAMMREA